MNAFKIGNAEMSHVNSDSQNYERISHSQIAIGRRTGTNQTCALTVRNDDLLIRSNTNNVNV